MEQKKQLVTNEFKRIYANLTKNCQSEKIQKKKYIKRQK